MLSLALCHGWTLSFSAVTLGVSRIRFFLRRHRTSIKVWQLIGNVGMRNCWNGYFGGKGGSTPPPEIFLTKNVIFHTNQLNSSSYDRKIWGVRTPSLRGASPPENFSYILDLGWLRAFTCNLPWLDLSFSGVTLGVSGIRFFSKFAK